MTNGSTVTVIVPVDIVLLSSVATCIVHQMHKVTHEGMMFSSLVICWFPNLKLSLKSFEGDFQAKSQVKSSRVKVTELVSPFLQAASVIIKPIEIKDELSFLQNTFVIGIQ